jgi:tetratricopeptide (TPR) repeat protein
MRSEGPSGPLHWLAPEVRDFAAGPFVLLEDLDRLLRVYLADAPEAVIFYCARILEALAAEALRAVHLRAGANVFANLDTLRQLGLLPSPTRYWAHALRRLGNRVRHLHDRVGAEDAEASILYAEHCLDWFFCRYRYRPHRRLERLTHDGRPFALAGSAELRTLMQALSAALDLPALVEQVRAGGRPAWLREPALAAVLAETLLDRGRHADAQLVLDAGLARFPLDLRLNQLLGLHWSRTGRLQDALGHLERLAERYPGDDETAGISAGVCKRLWQGDRGRTEWLARSHRAYRLGWERSGCNNPYLGINAATTALWLGRPEEARRTAEGVRRLLQGPAAALRPADDEDPLGSYWDRVTLAEALLLVDDRAAARRTYREAFARHAEQVDAIAVTQRQLGALLEALGLSPDTEAFLREGPEA